jgi:hypothetical protein
VKQVRRTRAQWTPTKHSVLCSEHFSEDSFEVDSAIAATFGIPKKRRLKPDAVPTIFQRQSSLGSASEDQLPRKRLATDTDPPTANSSKRARAAAEKRERIRVSSSYLLSAFTILYAYARDTGHGISSYHENQDYHHRLLMNCLILTTLRPPTPKLRTQAPVQQIVP